MSGKYEVEGGMRLTKILRVLRREKRRGGKTGSGIRKETGSARKQK